MKTEVSNARIDFYGSRTIHARQFFLKDSITVNPEGQGFCFFLGDEGACQSRSKALMGDGEWGNKREPPATDSAM